MLLAKAVAGTVRIPGERIVDGRSVAAEVASRASTVGTVKNLDTLLSRLVRSWLPKKNSLFLEDRSAERASHWFA